jgi:hypothetical protein
LGATPVYLAKPLTAAKDNDIDANSGLELDDPLMVPIPVILEKQAQEFSSSSNTRKITWSNVSHTVWLPPSAAAKLREKFIQKQGIEVEVDMSYG